MGTALPIREEDATAPLAVTTVTDDYTTRPLKGSRDGWSPEAADREHRARLTSFRESLS